MKTWDKDQCNDSALKITTQELIDLGFSVKEIKQPEIKGKLKTYGPWSIPVSYRALAMSCTWTPEDQKRYSYERNQEIAYGIRTMSNVRQSGYDLEGYVSIKKKKYSAFTSSQLFEIVDDGGRLIDVATIHVRMR